ncbi:MAG TPA: helix-turn-helix domain-containing protein [Gammaproteobacteria bacterium]|nr:helix-turn-helix domain-containing protein [Gammaproteobacteria bacterium]
MGRKAKVLNLSSTQRVALEQGYNNTKSPIFSRRCHIILLKSEQRTSKEIAKIFGITDQAVNNWVKRYEASGIAGLQTKPGRGRKPILNKEQDAEKVKAAVKKERQRLKHAKEALEQELNKKFSLLTLKRFLKNLSADGNASA